MRNFQLFLVLLLLIIDTSKSIARKFDEKMHIYAMFPLGGDFGPTSQMEHSLLNTTLLTNSEMVGALRY